MKNLALITALFCLLTAPALAQQHWLGAQGGSALPSGDLKDATTSGGYGGVYWDFAFSKSFQTRVDVSWVQFSSRSHDDEFSSKARVLPARAGLLWNFGPQGARFYFGAMAGAYMQEITVNDQGVETSIEKTFLGFSPCLGVHIPVGSEGNQIEIQASYDLWIDNESTEGEDLDMGFVRLGAGFRFAI